MKPSQTVLLLVLVVVLVFAVTFASMYVAQHKPTPSPKNDGGAKGTAGHLTFPVKAYPTDKEDYSQRTVTEYGTKGSRGFWFENAHDGPVRVGLNSRNCTCSDVVLYVAAESWRPRMDRVLTTRAVAGTAGVLPGLLMAAGVEQWSADLMEKADKGHDLSEKEEPTVAKGAFGFVRLRWIARRSGTPVKAELLKANLWMQNPVGGGNLDLEAAALLVEALRVDTKEVTVGTLGPGEKKTHTVRVWSTTRPFLQEPTVNSTGAPFITCGKPEPLTKNEMEMLQDRGGLIQSGYRMTIEVREQLPNGMRIDEGHFVHKVKIRPREDISLAEPLDIVVQGIVQGEVSLVGTGSGINLGEFAVRNGKTQDVTLQTERTDLKLTVEKYPPFMTVKLSEPKMDGGLKTWSLLVEIGPNKVSGSFPRADAEAYRDSAIYLQVSGSVNRKLRIPVKGNATQ